MSTLTTAATLNLNLSWSQSDPDAYNSSNTYTDAGTYSYNRNYSSGTGSTPAGYSVAGKLWHESRILNSGETRIYSLTGLNTTIFSGSFYTSFNNVKTFYVENLSTGVGQNISVYATGTNGFSGIFNSQSGNYIVGPKSPFIFSNFLTGWAIYSGNSDLTIKDLGGVTGTGAPSGCYIRIAIVGI